MTAPEHATTGAPCWVDLGTSDPDRSRVLYGELLGWEALEASEEFGGYFMFTNDGVPVAGCMPVAGGPPRTGQWSVYLNSSDARKTIDVAETHGGHVVGDAMDVADLGTMGTLVDAGGATVGIWEPYGFQGLASGGGPGRPVWFELLARDYPASVAFYRDVFGWEVQTMSDTAEFRYSTLGAGDGARAGMMDAAHFLPAGVPADWSIYFGVDDADAALAQVFDLGGSVLMAAEDTPYGRVGTAADADGARFRVGHLDLAGLSWTHRWASQVRGRVFL